MPNWCSTNIEIIHDNPNVIETLYKKIEQWTGNNCVENSFGTSWLGNVVVGAGLCTADEVAHTNIRCRGSICYMDLYHDRIMIQTETAWAPMLRMWQLVVDKYAPEAEIIYTAEEPGCELYTTNDPTLVGKYIIDSCDDRVENLYDIEERELIDILQDLLNTKEADVNKLLDMLQDSEFSENVWIHQREFCEIDNCD